MIEDLCHQSLRKKGDGRRGQKKVLEETMAKNFLNLAKTLTYRFKRLNKLQTE